ncbi:hypothetical protein GLOTRDRAFT_137086 [Gloeophyllum trabeum ATCC 11539]|uniref:Nucleotide-sugar transporter n=1 Tax=Gloeophyllum trabeum (strain ATCC 11539 / FP-39264 / Madison 617) TaxID=670483 RepID=S7RY66_GLOTA|nr:uncharacterized protein GLOTRDRAFT_137086 [Gloeophyllum trabeum ATCC 11539]EPQ58349.1 hypothetical protein GLOTRDRAFT_137086 [Gloeophyllum trabeum ATCC 11539]
MSPQSPDLYPPHSAQFSKSQQDKYDSEELGIPQLNDAPAAVPSICGMPLKYVSLVTLAVQNALLTIIMHYSRVSTAPSRTYSAAAAVLMNELLKGFISLVIAFVRLDRQEHTPSAPKTTLSISGVTIFKTCHPRNLMSKFRRLGREVFSPDCWKLSIPSILYVIQNNLQYVAASNLDAATFQVSYQMKILTTAAFSVLLLRRKLSFTKWFALLLLAVGVGIVQIQSGAVKITSAASTDVHVMQPLKGFLAVAAACFTSGLAGVYFEMVLKNSPADLWVRNVQLSLFSLLPALVPIIAANASSPVEAAAVASQGCFLTNLFRNFGPWAWATVLIQVFGGLVTALVIKYSDNIMKGFATSLSIVISFLASVALFDFRITFAFTVGSLTVLLATWLYNQPDSSNGKGWKWSRPCSLWRRSSGVSVSSASVTPRRPLSPVLPTSRSASPAPWDPQSPDLEKKKHGSSLSLSHFISFSQPPRQGVISLNDAPEPLIRPPASPHHGSTAPRSSSLSLLPGHPVPVSRTPPPMYQSPRTSFVLEDASPISQAGPGSS